MKILWVKTDFLHPTTRGGQIRTLEMLRRLHARHEIHYVAFHDPEQPEGLARSSEYSARAYPVERRIPPKRSLRFAAQLAAGLFDPLPVAVSRYRSGAMKRVIRALRRQCRFDSVVCDFLAPAPNVEDLKDVVLFQHNVETMIWRRHRDTAGDWARKLYFALQARRMWAYERQVCRAVKRVVAVSETDAEWMRSLFGLREVAVAATGVDIAYFSPPAERRPVADLIFVGSMDWMANIDGVKYFVSEVLPLIRRRRPDCTLAVVGRDPAPEIRALAREDTGIQVTGTVPDIRPYLWGARVSVVPLRIGGGTRLKIYESMAAKVPVVSTSVGAEGLACRPSVDIRIADTPETFAQACCDLLEDAGERARMTEAAWELVASRFSWDRVVRDFEELLRVER